MVLLVASLVLICPVALVPIIEVVVVSIELLVVVLLTAIVASVFFYHLIVITLFVLRLLLLLGWLLILLLMLLLLELLLGVLLGPLLWVCPATVLPVGNKTVVVPVGIRPIPLVPIISHVIVDLRWVLVLGVLPYVGQVLVWLEPVALKLTALAVLKMVGSVVLLLLLLLLLLELLLVVMVFLD